MPFGMPFQFAPKSGCRDLVRPMLLISVSEFGSTGARSIAVFQGLSAGKGRNPRKLALTPRPGRPLPPPSPPPAKPTAIPLKASAPSATLPRLRLHSLCMIFSFVCGGSAQYDAGHFRRAAKAHTADGADSPRDIDPMRTTLHQARPKLIPIAARH